MLTNSSLAREQILRCQFMPVFLKDGFIPYLPQYDQGIDFILYREADDCLIKVQQKGRWTLSKKYLKRHLSLVFPSRNVWYLCRHDLLFKQLTKCSNIINTDSWAEKGEYHGAHLPVEFDDRFQENRLDARKDAREINYSNCKVGNF